MAKLATAIINDSDDPTNETAPGGSRPDGSEALASLTSRGSDTGGSYTLRTPNVGDEPIYVPVDVDDGGQPFNDNQDDGGGEEQQVGRQQQREDRGGEGDGQQFDDQGSTEPRYRRSARERREARKQGRERLQSENSILRAELDEIKNILRGQIEPRLTEYDQHRAQDQVTTLDGQIEQHTARAAAAKRRLTDAIANGDAEAVAVAMDERDEAVRAGIELQAKRNQLAARVQDPRQGGEFDRGGAVRGQQPQQRQPERPALPPAWQENIRDFSQAHPWYVTDPRQAAVAAPADALDTQVVLAIDRAVAAEGFDPAGYEYWNRMEELMRERLPHRFQAGRSGGRSTPNNGNGQGRQAPPRQVAPERRGPMVGGSGDRSQAPGARGSQQVHLTRDRKEALMAAGVLAPDGRTVEDGARFQKFLAAYAKFDSENPTTARR